MSFHYTISPIDEMHQLERLRACDPESAANVVANSKLLFSFVQQGNLRAVKCALEYMQEDHVLLFYSVRMFRAACTSNRLDILRFMLANGFDVAQVGVRDILHCIIDAVHDTQTADAAQPILRFLLETGVDVNWQRPSDLFTALHIACVKNLFAITHMLLLYGADVNAVAMNDKMPLTCAEQHTQPLESCNYSTELEQSRQLIALLGEHNARRTWRKSLQTAQQISTAQMTAAETATEAASMSKPAAPSYLRRSVVSFSGVFSVSRHHSHELPLLQISDDVSRESLDVHSPEDTVDAVRDAFAHGIMLDTAE